MIDVSNIVKTYNPDPGWMMLCNVWLSKEKLTDFLMHQIHLSDMV